MTQFMIAMDLVISILISILVVCVFTVAIVKYGNKSRKKRAPLASGAWPIIGHLHLLGRHPDPPHKVFAAMADKFGPIFSIKLGFNETIVVSNAKIAKECFTTNDTTFSGRPKSIAVEVMGYNYALFGFGPYGSYWRQMRKIFFLELLSNHCVEFFGRIRRSEVKTCTKEMYNLWQNNNMSGSHHNNKVLVEMKNRFSDLSVHIIFRIVLGKRYSNKEEDMVRFRKAVGDFVKLIGIPLMGDAYPLLRWLDYGGYEKKMKAISKELDDILQKWLDEHKQKRISIEGTKGEQDFMDAMLSILESETHSSEEKETRYDADTIHKAMCLTAFNSATDSITATLTWSLSLLLNNPHALKMVQEELDSHVGKEKQVEESDLKNLVYLHAVIKEAMRLCPTEPVLFRESMEDCTVGGYHVPKGTRLLINIAKIQHDPSKWDNPYEFMPERFLSTHKHVEARGQHFELIPFGSGRRMCPGISFALQLMHLTLAHLLQSFEFEKLSDEPIDMSEDSGLFINLKTTPLEVHITPRLSPDLFE